MRDGSRRSGTAAHHLAEIATRETDVTQQVVVELQQVGIGPAPFRAAEEVRDHAHLGRPIFGDFGVAAKDGAAYDAAALNGI